MLVYNFVFLLYYSFPLSLFSSNHLHTFLLNLATKSGCSFAILFFSNLSFSISYNCASLPSPFTNNFHFPLRIAKWGFCHKGSLESQNVCFVRSPTLNRSCVWLPIYREELLNSSVHRLCNLFLF